MFRVATRTTGGCVGADDAVHAQLEVERLEPVESGCGPAPPAVERAVLLDHLLVGLHGVFEATELSSSSVWATSSRAACGLG